MKNAKTSVQIQPNSNTIPVATATPVFKRKRLFFDIETSPNLVLSWNVGYKQMIDYNNIVKERAIMCICYKWEGEDEVHYLFWDKSQNDRAMLKKFIEVANTADELVGHNGDKFDLPWIRTRCLYHELSMFPKYNTLDTLKVARNKFRFNSNRLDYIAKFLGIGAKIKTEFDLWKRIVLSNDTEAKDLMIEYCQEDVRLLEKVYNRLKNHTENKTHYGVIINDNKSSCSECGSENIKLAKKRITASGYIRNQYQCKDCGKYHTQTGTKVKKDTTNV